MFKILLFFTLIELLYSFEPTCSTCKFFIPNVKKPELGLCSMFKDRIYVNNKERLIKNLALHCRSNENLCGKAGYLYEPVNINDKLENYEYIKSLCCGEFVDACDLKELNDIENDLVDIFDKMKKQNTKNVYKTKNQLNKLVKRRD